MPHPYPKKPIRRWIRIILTYGKMFVNIFCQTRKAAKIKKNTRKNLPVYGCLNALSFF